MGAKKPHDESRKYVVRQRGCCTHIHLGREADIQQQLDGATRNKTIYLRISKKLQENGFERDWQQCKAKIKNLKFEYKRVKDHNSVTGNGRKTCKFYEKLDAILGHRPSSAPSVLMDAGSSSLSAAEPLQDSPEEDGK